MCLLCRLMLLPCSVPAVGVHFHLPLLELCFVVQLPLSKGWGNQVFHWSWCWLGPESFPCPRQSQCDHLKFSQVYLSLVVFTKQCASDVLEQKSSVWKV